MHSNTWQPTQDSSLGEDTEEIITDSLTDDSSIYVNSQTSDNAIYKESTIKVASHEHSSFEQQLGIRLPVWIGGVALAFAGFFMVKYSIEVGLLTPKIRVLLGLLFGCGLLYAGYFVL